MDEVNGIQITPPSFFPKVKYIWAISKKLCSVDLFSIRNRYGK